MMSEMARKQERMKSSDFVKSGLGKSTRSQRVRHDYKADLLAQIALAGLPAPCGEFLFARPRRWRFDFCWERERVSLEFQGGIYAQERSGHSTVSGLERDYRKFSEASIRGWKLILVTAGMVRSGEAFQLIERALKG
jgi:hypothetical protein